MLHGLGRIIDYEAADSFEQPSNDQFLTAAEKRLLRVTEGKFYEGRLEGYGRIYSVEDATGYCSVGFYTGGELDGKAEVYD